MGNEMTTTATIVGTDGCSASAMHSTKPMNDNKTKDAHEEQHNIVVFPIVHAEEQTKHNGVAYNLRRTSHSHNTNVCDEANETINKAAALCPAVAEALRQHELAAHHPSPPPPPPPPPVRRSNIDTTITAQEVITIDDDNNTRDSDSDNINAMTGKKHNVSVASSKAHAIISLQQQNSTSPSTATTVGTVAPRADGKPSLKHKPTQKMSMTMPMPNPTSVKSAVAPPALPTTSTNTTSSSHSCSISNKPLTFPQKLHLILSNPQLEGIIQWLPHGRAWKIIQVKTFEQKVLPLYFHHCKYTSFIRQVNAWGFRRITYHQYYHEMFVRGTPQLCAQMKRLNKEDMEKRKKEGNVAIPNFNLINKENAMKVAQQQPPTPHRYYSKSGTLNKSSAQIVMQYHDNASQSLPPLMTTSSIPQHPQLQSPPSSSHYSRQTIMSQQQLLAQHSQRYPQQQQMTNTTACSSQQSTMSKRERMIREQGRRLEQLRKKKTQAKKQGLSVTNAELVAALAMGKLGGGVTTSKTK